MDYCHCCGAYISEEYLFFGFCFLCRRDCKDGTCKILFPEEVSEIEI